jgi:hypothetical protein
MLLSIKQLLLLWVGESKCLIKPAVRAQSLREVARSINEVLLWGFMDAAVVSPFLTASLEDQERLCTSISSILHQCTRGYSSLIPAAVVDKLLQV